MVGLVRETRNPTDPNTITVINDRASRVGYIESSAADVLAPLIDSSTIFVGAIVPKPPGAPKTLCLPVQIHIFTRLADSAYVQSALAGGDLSLISDTHPDFALLGGGLPHPGFALSEEANAEEESDEDLRLDDIFAMVAENNAEIVALEPLKDIVLTELLAHQKEALGWLVDRENPHHLPPFWEEKDGDDGFCFLPTNHQTTDRPEPLRGGILADDLGSGKILTLLSLIATDRPSFTAHGSKRVIKQNDVVFWPRATLVVCTKSIMLSWITQLEEHINAGALKFCSYYQEENKDIEELKEYDIVLTTYDTMASGYGSGGCCTLGCIDWLRVVLDEAHVIKNLESKQAKAVLALKAERRWAITPTPIPSSNIYTLFSFLRFKPFTTKSVWNRLISLPLRKGKKSGMLRLQSMIGTIIFRRMKDTCGGERLVVMPPKVVETCFFELSAEERKRYDDMESWSQSLTRSFIVAGTLQINCPTLFLCILWLFQICNDVALCPSNVRSLLANNLEDVSKNPELQRKFLSKIEDLNIGKDFECPVCFNEPDKVIITHCAHIFCEACILKVLKDVNPCCPMCRRRPFSRSDIFFVPPTMLSNENEDDLQKLVKSGRPLSSKSKTLLRLLIASKEANPCIKSVVFSLFSKMLILLEEPLKAAGFRVLRLDGSMNIKKRAELIQEFRKNGSGSPTILLAPFYYVCASINLTAASRVYLLDSWFDPGVEEQLVDSVHQLGQEEELMVIRLIVKNSIEERVLELQERNKRLAGGALGRNSSEYQADARLEDMCNLLGFLSLSCSLFFFFWPNLHSILYRKSTNFWPMFGIFFLIHK